MATAARADLTPMRTEAEGTARDAATRDRCARSLEEVAPRRDALGLDHTEFTESPTG